MQKRDDQFHLVFSSCYDEQVAENHFLRRLDKAIDFSFVEEMCAPKYKKTENGPGRPYESPVRMFKLLLLMFLYQIKSERSLPRMAGDSISCRWYCGYAPDETVPSHKTIWAFRNRLGSEVFDSIFTEVLKRCIDSGLVDNKRWHIDATNQNAAAGRYSKYDTAAILTRAMVARIEDNGSGESVDYGIPPCDMDDEMKKLVARAACEVAKLKNPNLDRVIAKSEDKEYASVESVEKEETEIEPVESEPDPRLAKFKEMAADIYKQTAPCAGDKDARIGHTSSKKSFCGYISTVVADGKHGVVLGYETYAGNVDQSKTFMDPYTDALEIAGKPVELAADSGFDDVSIRKRLEEDGVVGHVAMIRPSNASGVYGSECFKVSCDNDCYCVKCPAKRMMQMIGSSKDGYLIFEGVGCAECSLLERCTKDKNKIRKFRFKPETRKYQEKHWLHRKTKEYKEAMKARMSTIEPIFGHAKTYHNLGKCIYRSKLMTYIQTSMSLLVVNVEKYVKYGNLPQTA